MDVAHAEHVESGLDLLIEKRDKQRRRDEGGRQAEEMYMQSVRRYQDRQHQERLWSWLRYHEGQMFRLTATYEHLIGRHRLEVQKCEAALGIDQKGDAAKL